MAAKSAPKPTVTAGKAQYGNPAWESLQSLLWRVGLGMWLGCKGAFATQKLKKGVQNTLFSTSTP
jgi:hypothetical protein